MFLLEPLFGRANAAEIIDFINRAVEIATGAPFVALAVFQALARLARHQRSEILVVSHSF